MSSETGHCVNQSNFGRLVDFCVSKGGAYQPTLIVITLPKIQAKKITIDTSMDAFLDKAAIWGDAVNIREAAYAPVNTLMRQVRSAVDVSDVLDEFKKDVHGVVNEILGVRATPKMKMMPENPSVPTDESIKQISAAQTGFDNKLGNVKKLVAMLKVQTNYAPNENDIKLATLQALVTDIVNKNDKVGETAPPMLYGRDDRDKELYAANDGAFDLASKIKKYFKAAFGPSSNEYKHIAKLKFVKLAK